MYVEKQTHTEFSLSHRYHGDIVEAEKRYDSCKWVLLRQDSLQTVLAVIFSYSVQIIKTYFETKQ